MAIVRDNNSLGAFSASPLTFSHTIGTGNNGILLVYIWRNSPSDAVNTVAYNGVGMTAVNSGVTDGTADYAKLYYLLNPPTGAHNVVVTMSSGSVGAYAFSYFGVNQAAPEANSTNSANPGTSLTDTLTTIASGAWMVGGVSSDAGNSFSAGAGTSVLAQSTANNMALIDSNGTLVPGSNSLNVTCSSQRVQSVFVSLAPAAPITQTLTENVTMTATIKKQVGRILSEAPTFSDVLAAVRTKFATLIELVYLRDTPNIYNGDFASQPPFTASTTSIVDGRWIDGTASGSTTNSTWGWGNIRTTNGNITTKFDTVGGRSCITIAADSLSKAGAAVGQVGIENIAAFPGSTINSNRLPYLIPVQPNTNYTIAGDYYLQSVSDTSHINSNISAIFYDSTLARVQTSSISINNTNLNNWTTVQGNITSPASAAYLAIGPRIAANGTDASGLSMTVSWTNITMTLHPVTVTGLLFALGRNLIETLTLTDTFARLLQWFRTFTETATLTDLSARAVTHTKTLLQSLTILDKLRALLNGLDARFSKKYPSKPGSYDSKYPKKEAEYTKKYP